MAFLSVIIPTMRAGGIDILIDALAAQEYTDFELVLVDALYRHRRDLVAAYARDRFVRLVHVEPRPNPFPVAAFCAMANAGLVAATGEVVVHMVDYSRPRPDCLRRHAEFHKNSDEYEGFMGPHQYVQLDVPYVPGKPHYAQSDAAHYEGDLAAGQLDPWMISFGTATDQPAEPWVVDGGNLATWDADPKLRMPAGHIAPVFFHGKNESLWLSDALAVNGWDEDLDGTHCYQDSDYADRLSVVAGVQWTLDPQCIVEIANPRGVFPLARRLRDFRENEKIWHAKRAAGYPRPNRYSFAERRAEPLSKNFSATGAIRYHIGNFVAPAVGEGVAVPPPAGLPKDLPAGADFPKTREESMGIGTPFRGSRDHYDPHEDEGYDYQRISPVEKPRPLRVAMIYGEFSSAIHGPFDFAKLGESGLTGSEGSFFNLARSLAERGHSVVVLAPAVGPHVHESGAHMLPLRPTIDALPRMELDAVLAWNEPDYLAHAPAGSLSVVDQQLNDWGYCKESRWADMTDVFVFPSESSKNNHAHTERVAKAGAGVIIPNSVDLDLFAGPPPPNRYLHRVVYCSSPDRGLHHLLAFWPAVRARVPDAELKIFYRIEPWFRGNLLNPSEVGRRARFVEDALRRMRDGFGVEVVGPVHNREMARQLRMAAVLAYPCDPVRYTEGFGCSVLDACAAGCLPIISDADALAEVHGQPAVVISGKPDHDVWADNVASALERPAHSLSGAMAAHAQKHSRIAIAQQWERLLLAHRRT